MTHLLYIFGTNINERESGVLSKFFMASEQENSGPEKEDPKAAGSVKQHVDQGKRIPSPYDLNASDNPGNIITQVKLRGENYDEWARSMRTSLRARRKWGFVDGTIEQPEEGSIDLEDWWTVQSMLVSWILNTVEPSLRSTMTYSEHAKDLWEDIKERFSVINGPRIQQLKSDLASCKQEGMSMV